jgi:arylsulfatase A-like enzyme
LHVPLVLVWPGAPAGARVAERVEQIDVGRTLLDLAGLAAAAFPGRDLREVLAGRSQTEAAPHFALHDSGLAASITSGGYHLILQLADSPPTVVTYGRKRHELELYDLRTDPACADERSDEEPERAAALRRALIEWLESAEDLGWSARAATDAELDARLTELGYAEIEGPGTTLWVPDDCEQCRRWAR